MLARIKYFIALAVLSQVVTGQDPSLFCLDQATCCEGVPDVTSLGDWDNCTIFYMCFGGVPSVNHCTNPSFPAYNPVTTSCIAQVDGCVDGTRAPISQTTTPMTTITTQLPISTTESHVDGNCTEDGAYFVPYPGDCTKYMICSSNVLLPDVQQCPPGTLFDPDLRECNLEDLVECKPQCPEIGTITLPHDKNCSLYWLCSMGTANLRQCPQGLVYDPILTTCNVETLVFCPNLCPPEGAVNLPHASNCSLYWLCTFGSPTLRSCPADLLFDPVLGQCNLPSEVNCGSHSIAAYNIVRTKFSPKLVGNAYDDDSYDESDSLSESLEIEDGWDTTD